MKTLYLDHDIRIPYNNIVYLEHFSTYSQALHRITILHTTSSKHILRLKIKEVYALLDDQEFMLCHQSYIVNMQFIKVFSQLYLLLDDDTRIPISIKRSTLVRLQFLKYIKERSI